MFVFLGQFCDFVGDFNTFYSSLGLCRVSHKIVIALDTLMQEVLWESSSDEEDDAEEGVQVEGDTKGDGKQKERAKTASEGVVDVEDMGSMLHQLKVSKERKKEGEVRKRMKMEPREMVTPLLKKNLTKQGVWHTMYSRFFNGY